MRTPITGVGVLLFLLAASATSRGQDAQPASEANLASALSRVRWHGAPPSADIVKGKSSIVVVYATWCPKCNEWSTNFFKQVKEAAIEQPVTVFAINADKTSPGPGYAAERGFVGPNIVHGSDAGMPARLGFTSELFKFAAFDTAGELIERGEGGSYYEAPTGNVFVLANNLREGKYPGEFAILSREMSPQLKQLLWPVELGQPINDKSLVKLRGQLPANQHEAFNVAIDEYLDKHLARSEEGVAGDVPQQIEAHSLATVLAERFATTPQGKKARAMVTKFDEDAKFKQELAAAAAYRKAVAGGTPAAMKRALVKVAKRFEGTHYGKLASEQSTSSGT
jgi:hypothetical protein